MMKLLTLVRHAKSSWKDPVLPDFERPLNKRGLRDAPAMGERMAGFAPGPDWIVSSPARRARETAEIIADRIGYPRGKIAFDPRIYESSARGLIELIRGFDDARRHVMLFGHNPALTELVEILTGRPFENVPTCGVVRVRFGIESWALVDAERADLVAFEQPKEA
jgi:phosphohistidine phosphatase